ncbi:phage tail domain-containing protein [Staphylococcus saprophyticus]|uniref:phage tail domain-containing protein n=1 Tax=Staphylococcus saprophyticus TaxID=29385 RepID=UPI00119F8C94|nr:phage tail domain-containing protein [Staphylococcus saprophyticus]MBN6755863.1 phage tail family protein [Staphylococcus saprophyticus]MBN6765841.1 phage tail family protein [Staphylococcus saprophyticus]MBN6771258.1 phage tail family protein [Staphylococcus saprophyticus]MBN6780176.1 phage tail family protein [Staphylococcus saprophyticus]MBN6787606.1 phage tail family protein [Staphylococcus saprophyticus]
MKKEVKLITNDKTINLTDFENFMYLDYVENDVQINSNTTEINGVDGVLTGASTFAPFELELRFMFSGVDIHDYHLFKHKLRQIIYQREPYYVWHSDMPGKKYAVLPNATEIEDIYSRNGEISITFSVFKGYSESLKDTDEFSLSSGDWQFEGGLLSDEEIKYTHNKTNFKIYNGSTDTINPLLRHRFKMVVNIDAPKGFKIANKTTGDVFEYKRGIKSNQTLTINGVHPFINNQRVGINTNWQWLTLDEGFNKIEITGENIGNVQTQWVFPFIYR